MLSLRQLFVQTPKHLDDTQRGGSDRIGKVTTCPMKNYNSIHWHTYMRISIDTGTDCHLIPNVPGGDTAPTRVTLPSLEGFPRQVTRPARS